MKPAWLATLITGLVVLVSLGCGSSGKKFAHAVAPPTTNTMGMVTTASTVPQPKSYGDGQLFADNCTLAPNAEMGFSDYGTVFYAQCPSASNYKDVIARAPSNLRLPVAKMKSGSTFHLTGTVYGVEGGNINLSSQQELVVTVTAVT